MASIPHGNHRKGARMTAGRMHVRHEEPNYDSGREILSGSWGLHLFRALWDRVPACLNDLCSAVRRQQDRRDHTSHAFGPLLSCLMPLNPSQMIPQLHLARAFTYSPQDTMPGTQQAWNEQPCQLSSRTRGEVGRTRFCNAKNMGQTFRPG